MKDFEDHGYEYIRELGVNRAAGRAAHLCKDSKNGALVVVKQFQFLKSNSSWDGHKAIEREVDILKQLNHPRIPKYLNNFETSNGSCLVQEYIDASALSGIIKSSRLFTPEQIKSIVTELLEIIVYLQTNFLEPVIHRDIKPANILIDDDCRPYLIDFGGAKVSEGEGGSTVATGTLGFMPPEQRILKFNQTTDVYSLGLTIVCWLTRTEPSEMDSIINPIDNRVIGLMKQLSSYSPRFIEWIEKVVQPDPRERYLDAKNTLDAFAPLYIKRLPKVTYDKSTLKVESKRIGDKVKTSVRVCNEMPDTMLEGWWTVESHHNDPESAAGNHPWIHFSAQNFQSNQIDFTIFVDTERLMASTLYTRKLLLSTNGDLGEIEIPIFIQTALLPTGRRAIPLVTLLAVWGISFTLTSLLIIVAVLACALWALIILILIAVIMFASLENTINLIIKFTMPVLGIAGTVLKMSLHELESQGFSHLFCYSLLTTIVIASALSPVAFICPHYLDLDMHVVVAILHFLIVLIVFVQKVITQKSTNSYREREGDRIKP
jgi:serine/threonine protein kinase